MLACPQSSVYRGHPKHIHGTRRAQSRSLQQRKAVRAESMALFKTVAFVKGIIQLDASRCDATNISCKAAQNEWNILQSC